MNSETVMGKYLLSAFYVVLDFGLAWVSAWLVARQLPSLAMLAGRNVRLAFSLLGSGLLLTAAIGTLAWPLHSSRDQEIFFCLSLAGGFLLIYLYALNWLE